MNNTSYKNRFSEPPVIFFEMKREKSIDPNVWLVGGLFYDSETKVHFVLGWPD